MTRRLRLVLALSVGVPLAILLGLAMFPWGLLAGSNIRPLARAIGRPVTVGSARRLDWFGLTPTIALDDVTIGQPGWQGKGAMTRIAHVRLTVPVLPLLAGRLRPRRIDIDGLRLALFRTADGRANWSGEGKPGRSPPPPLAHLTIRDARFRLFDLGRHVVLAGDLVSDETHGFAIRGRGTLRAAPLAVAVTGGALGEADPRRPYPLRLVARSPLVTVDARATLDRPLDLDGFTARVASSGRDLAYLDDLVQAGLFPTRAFRLDATVRRDDGHWRIAGLRGLVGRSQVAADVAVARDGVRTRIDGRVEAAAFDFADFTSAAQRARAAVRLAASGLLPETSIDLKKLARLDGVLRFRAARLLTGSGSPFRSLATTATLDHGRLTLDPIDAGLIAGRLTGQVTVDDGGTLPRLTLDTRIDGSTIQALVLKDGAIAGPLAVRTRLTGRGETFRAAIGAASGTIGVSVQGGTMRRDYATFVGGDVVRSVGAARNRVALRCLAGVLRARGGDVVPDPLSIDTAVSRAAVGGRVDLRSERIDLVFKGRSKQPGPIRSITLARLFGMLTDPQVDIRPPRATDQARTGLLARVGTFVAGLRVRGDTPRDAPAPDADCAGLARMALR